jgi:hypothetical protein
VTPVLDNKNATAATDKLMTAMYVTRKGTHKNITEKYYIYGKSKNGIQINDKHSIGTKWYRTNNSLIKPSLYQCSYTLAAANLWHVHKTVIFSN